MVTRLYPDSDMLYLALADAPSVEGEEVADGIVFHYDARSRIVSIEIDEASKRVDLTDILKRPETVVNDSGPGTTYYTTAEAASRLKITKFAVQKIRRAMKDAGEGVGIRQDRADSMMSELDLERIRVWRKTHKRGRPPKTKAPLA